MRYRILHISDVHTGPPFRQTIAAHLAAQAHEIKPDLLVISGDFVQRADFIDQWRAARALRESLPQPQLVVPGNHDVPLYHAHLRLLNPLGRYRRYISADLNPVFERPGLVVVGASSAQGFTMDNGWINQRQAIHLRGIFRRYGPETCKIAVWHHPVLTPTVIARNRTMRDARQAMQLLDECDVELLLCGHLHIAYVGNTQEAHPELRNGTIICQSGTTTSRRGHGPEHGRNTCNLITIDEQNIHIEQLLYQEQSGRFEPNAAHTFPRRMAHLLKQST